MGLTPSGNWIAASFSAITTWSWIEPREFFSTARSYGFFKRGEGGGGGKKPRRVFHSTFKRKTTFCKAGKAIHFLKQAIRGRGEIRGLVVVVVVFKKNLI